LLLTGLPIDAAERWEQLLQKIYPAAKGEGEVIFSTSRIEEVGGKQGLQQFQKRFPGIKVSLSGLSGRELVARVITEAKAGRVTIDAFRAGADRAKVFADRGLLLPIQPHELIGESLHGWFNNTYFKVTDHIVNFAYNTDRVTETDRPKRYEDLLNPKWKRKLILYVQGTHISHLLAEWGEQKFWEFVKALKKQEPIWAERDPESMAKIVAAEGLVGNASYSEVEQIKRKGAPIEFLFLSPAYAIERGIGIPKNSAHPNAAQLFVGWLLSPEGTKARDDLGVGTVRPGTKLYENVGVAGAKIKLDESFEEVLERGKIEQKIRKEWGALD